MSKTTYRVESDENDRQFADDLQRKTVFLCDLVEDMLEKHPTALLSPTMRDLLRDNARTLRHNACKPCNWFVDNPNPGSFVFDEPWK